MRILSWLPALLVAQQQQYNEEYRKLPVNDPTHWINEFQKEALETIGWLATTHNQSEFKKFGDGFRFKMMRRSDKIFNWLNGACPKRLWSNMPMEVSHEKCSLKINYHSTNYSSLTATTQANAQRCVLRQWSTRDTRQWARSTKSISHRATQTITTS